MITSVAGHFCIEKLTVRSALPITSVLDKLEADLSDNNMKRIGNLGNRVATKSRLIGTIDTVNFIIPDSDTLDTVGEAYIQMTKHGHCEHRERQLLVKAEKI